MAENGGRRSRYYRNRKETGLTKAGGTSLGAPAEGGKRLPVEYDDDLGSASEKQTVTSSGKTPMPIGAILMIFVCTVMFMMMVWSFVRINEYTVEIEGLQDRLDTLKSSRSQLTIQLEQKNNLQEIQEYAVNVLGMVKIDQLAKKYITVDKEDAIVVFDESRKVPAPETAAADETGAPDETAADGGADVTAETDAPVNIAETLPTAETEAPVNIAETEAPVNVAEVGGAG